MNNSCDDFKKLSLISAHHQNNVIVAGKLQVLFLFLFILQPNKKGTRCEISDVQLNTFFHKTINLFAFTVQKNIILSRVI
jgi:hypothetical protein